MKICEKTEILSILIIKVFFGKVNSFLRKRQFISNALRLCVRGC